MFSRISTVPASTSIHDSLELTTLLEDLAMTDLVPILRESRIESVVSLRRLVEYHVAMPAAGIAACGWRQRCFLEINQEQRTKLEEWLANGGPTVASPSRRRCVICKCSEDTITKRGGPDVDFFDGNVRAGDDLICRSCIFKCAPCSRYESQRHLICGGCGFSEQLSEICGLGKFYPQVNVGLERHSMELIELNASGGIRCPTCRTNESAPADALITEAPTDDTPITEALADEGDSAILCETCLCDMDDGFCPFCDADTFGDFCAEALLTLELATFGESRHIGPDSLRRSRQDRLKYLEGVCGLRIGRQVDNTFTERVVQVSHVLGVPLPEDEHDQSFEDDLYMSDDDDDNEDPYEGELELEEEEIDNTDEKAKRIKHTIQGIGEILFDIKDKITEGEYLKLMDGLQSITNEINH